MTDILPQIVPHLVVSDAAAAIDFYSKALGASELSRMMAEDGKRILHADLAVNGARVFVRDDFPEYKAQHGDKGISPPHLAGSTGVTMHLEVANCDEAVKRAADAGATVIMPPWDAFWGARYGQIIDPFGHAWSFAHPLPAAA